MVQYFDFVQDGCCDHAEYSDNHLDCCRHHYRNSHNET
jgi:hypothetical protein